MRSLPTLLVSIAVIGACGFASDASEGVGGGGLGAGGNDDTSSGTGTPTGGGPASVTPPASDQENFNAAAGEVLLAGEWDDSLNFSWYLQFLEAYLAQRADEAIDVTGRKVIVVETEGQTPLANAMVQVPGEGPNGLVPVGLTASNGRAQVFPTHDLAEPLTAGSQITVDVPGLGPTPLVTEVITNGDGWEELKVVVPLATSEPPTELDVAFVIDATFSLAEEIEYLRANIKAIDDAIAPSVGGSIRYALVAYRDTVDDVEDQVTEVIDFETSLTPVADALAVLEAKGGGDYPEAVDQGLADALNLQWREGNIARIAFVIGDAPAHEDKLGTLNTLTEEARQRGIRLYPVGASGTGDRAQFYFRQAALATLGRYLFLTTDAALAGLRQAAAEEPYGTMPCYLVQNLSDLMVRMMKSELSGVREPALPGTVLATVGGPDVTGHCMFPEGDAYTSPQQP